MTLVDEIKKRLHVPLEDTSFDETIEECINNAHNYIQYLCLGKGIKAEQIDFENDMLKQAIKDIASAYFIVDCYPGQENQSNDFFTRGQNTLDVYLKVLSNQLKLKKIIRVDSDNYTPIGNLED